MFPSGPIPSPLPRPGGAGEGLTLSGLTLQAFQIRSSHRYALHPVEAALQYHRATAEIPSEEGHGGCGFAEAEAHYRAGAQGLRLPEIPQLPQQLRELSRFGALDRAGRKSLRKWAQDHGHILDEGRFLDQWDIPESEDLAVIDPYIALARLGTWAAIKLAEVGYPTPPDDPPPASPSSQPDTHP